MADAHDQGREHQRRDDHLDQPQKDRTAEGDVAGKHFGHPGEEALLVRIQCVPGSHGIEQWPGLAVGTGAFRLTVWVDDGQLGALGQQSQVDLALEDTGPDDLVAFIEDPLVPVRPFQRDQVRGVSRLGGEVHEEGLVRVDDLGVPDELHRLVGHVVGQVVAVLGTAGGLDRVIVVHEVRKVGVGLAAEPAVEALEPPAQRPSALVGGQIALLARGEVPFAYAVGVVPALGQHFGDESVLEGNPSRDPREP